MSPSSWSSSSNHHGGRGGRGGQGRGSSSHHDSRSNHGSNHGGQQERPAVPGITTQDQLNELTRIQANLRYHMSDLIGKLSRDLVEEKEGTLSDDYSNVPGITTQDQLK